MGSDSGAQVHLVDGTFELFRSYFGAPAAQSAAGQEVGATRGLLRSLYALTNRTEVSHVACAFDHVVESFRNQLYAGYKTGEGLEPRLYSQFELAERASEALGIVTWPMVEFEADDAIATACARFVGLPEVSRVVICSPDKDLCQCLVSDEVELWDRIRDRRLGPAGVVDKFGVEPASIPDYLALVGDSADGFPGIPRWGAKSASTLLAHYHHLERIPPEPQQWAVKVRGATALAKNLREGFDEALLYRRLATLRCDVPIAEELPALEYHGVNPSRLEELCRELDDMRFFERVQRDLESTTEGVSE